ncbi:hypothetical protein FB464_1689 [Subtercola boreus]|nr:hypothetical protein FB464_1689 [Subtercola boreus]
MSRLTIRVLRFDRLAHPPDDYGVGVGVGVAVLSGTAAW